MNAMTCEQVQEQLDLLAADACDPHTRQAVEHHLRACQACSASYSASQELVTMLDLHWSQQGMARLRERIEEQASRRPRQRLFLPFVQRALAAAAVVLLTLGLIWLQMSQDTSKDMQFALLIRPTEPARGSENRLKPLQAEAAVPAPPGESRTKAARQALLKAHAEGNLPQPTAVALGLTIVNTGERSVQVRLGDAATKLVLDVQGEGVVRIPVAGVVLPRFLEPKVFELDPGQSFMLPIDRLIAGSRRGLEYIYLMEEEAYMITPYLQFTADGRFVTVRGKAIRIKVGK